MSIHEAREYINNPKTSLQIPIPLKQTDYDLKNTNLEDKKINNNLLKFFYLTTIPKKLTDQIIKTLEFSDLELQGIELSFLSQSRLVDEEISYLKNNEGLIIYTSAMDNYCLKDRKGVFEGCVVFSVAF